MRTCKFFIQLLLISIFTIVLPAGMLKAQNTVAGKVIQDDTKEPVQYVTVQLLYGESGCLVNYTLTDGSGGFTIPAGTYSDSLKVQVTLLGYKKQQKSIVPGEFLQIELEAEFFDLREVEIRPGRVWGRQDTINYDVERFLSAQDQTIKDVIRKLPGVDVDDLGRISYNGKQITNFYVEGMDLMGGRYNQLTNNLRAESVETIQLLENHQPIRILTDKIKTEDIALNLKLKPGFRDRWMATVRLGTGLSPFLWETDDNAIQISRNKQSAYIYKSKNTGTDITVEQDILTGSSYKSGPDLSPFVVPSPLVASSLKESRWLFNHAHTLSGNRLYKLGENTKFKINANYLHDYVKQNRGEETTYYASVDTFRVREEYTTGIKSDRGELSFQLENNSTERFLVNQLDLSGAWQNANSGIYNDESINQQIRNREMKLKNYFQSIRPGETYNIEYRSLIQYYNLPSSLRVNGAESELALRQFYTDNSVSFIRKKSLLSQQYTAGFIGESTNIKNGYGIYFIPQQQVSKGKWLGTLRLPVAWRKYQHTDFSRIAVTPFFSLNYKYNYRWQYNIYLSYNEHYGDVTNFYDVPYYSDYRHVYLNKGVLPVTKQQFYSFRAEYRNTVCELFLAFNPVYTRSAHNTIRSQYVINNTLQTEFPAIRNYTETYSFNINLSKGFYDWGLNTSLAYRLGRTKGEQIMEGNIQPYKHDYIQIEPKINWVPAKSWNVLYEGNTYLKRSEFGDAKPDPLWDLTQKVSVSYELFPVILLLSADHYYNQITKDRSVHAFFADATVRWNTGLWLFELKATNLFDKKEYAYTHYGNSQTYTSWVNIRPREVLLSARYRF